MIYDQLGNRKYLTLSERQAFLDAAERAEPTVRSFCFTLAHLGARISEVLALAPLRVDPAVGYVIIESLKKRRHGIYRAVPAPKELFDLLEEIHGITAARSDPRLQNEPLWNWSRTTAWSRVKDVMADAGLDGKLAMPKALRHAFGVQTTAGARIPLNMVKKWMGHSRIETTAIYADAVGNEERKLADSIWTV
ncbi:MAG TPA: tyrosine-type recombinase/integrase [Rhizomicrobium sp.]|nr:tyrosine-type recombinase/integrase [Rhizomicrobium sp.]